MNTLKKFTIVHVDDHHEGLSGYMNKIKGFIEEKGFELIVFNSKDGNGVMEYFSEHIVDIFLADKNLNNNMKGGELIEEIDKKKIFTDVLYYSTDGLDDNDHKLSRNTKYVNVKEAFRGNIVPDLKRMINRNVQKWDDVIFLRGITISETIELERQIDYYFEKYFKIPNKRSSDFNYMVNGMSLSFEGKKRLLIKIINEHYKECNDYCYLKETIVKIQEFRNTLAHCYLDQKTKNQFITKNDKPVNKELIKRNIESIEKSIKILKGITKKFN